MRSYIISGLPGVGKTTAMNHAAQLGYVTVSVGDVVRQAFAERGGDESVADFVLRVHDEDGRAQFAREAVTAIDQRLSRAVEPAGAVIEGIHSPASARVVKRRFAPADILWVEAPLSARLDRLRRRENGYSMRDLFRRDLRELNSGLSALADPLYHDYAVQNDGSLRGFEQSLDAVFE